jgi:hypothetical protein
MARKRMIDPSFWIDEKVGTLDPLARLLFMGLISQADDEGRLNGHPALIKSLIFPYDYSINLVEVEKWLEELYDRKMIHRYTIDHQSYIAVNNFKKHQTINKPVPSKLPPSSTEDYGSPTVVIQDEDGTTTAQKKRSKEKRNEVEEKRSEVKEDYELTHLEGNPHFDLFQKELDRLSIPYIIRDLEEIVSFVGLMDGDLIMDAVKRAEGKDGASYALGILRRWNEKGYTKLSEVVKTHGTSRTQSRDDPETFERPPSYYDQYPNLVKRI